MIELKSIPPAVLACGMIWLAGCGNPQELESLRQENAVLARRVSELEEQVRQADAPAAASAESTQEKGTEYIVREGDNLWSIARKELGSGTRYREILALNPHITRNQPLPIGAVLKLPAR